LLDHIFNASYTPAATLYIALCTYDPSDDATGADMSECANANNYAREIISFGAAANKSIVQSGAITFNLASGSWGEVSHWAIVDNAAHGAGNCLAHGAFADSHEVVNGETPSIADGLIFVSYLEGGVSTYAGTKLLDLMFRNQAFASPATYVGLVTKETNDDDTGTTITEVSGGAYARKQVNINGGAAPTWNLAGGIFVSLVNNTNAVEFATATADWGTVKGVVVCDALTLGNLLLYDNNMTNLAIDDEDTAEFPIGELRTIMD
jgi:hypothetical protein